MVGGERKDGCSSMLVTSFGGLGMWDSVLVGRRSFKARLLPFPPGRGVCWVQVMLQGRHGTILT